MARSRGRLGNRCRYEVVLGHLEDHILGVYTIE
jgi:hypothetical protein